MCVIYLQRTNRGFWSFIDHEYTSPFALAMYTNRTFVFTQNSNNRPWIYLPRNGQTIPKLCQNRTGKNCIFKPVSNCTWAQIQNVIKYTKQHDTYTVIDYSHTAPDICKKSKHLDPDKFHELTKNYTLIYQRFECNLFWSHGKSMNRGLIEKLIKQRNWNINYYQYNAIIWSLLIRLQDNIQTIIHSTVRETLIKYKWKSKQNTLSLPIRASDKCAQPDGNQTYWSKPEMICFEPIQFLQIAQAMQHFSNNAFDTVIITSEDEKIISFVKNQTDLPFNFIFNDGDILQNSGNLQDMDKTKRNDEVEMFKLVLSMLSTIKLQMHSKYYIIQRQSNWAHAIWGLSSNIHCEIPDMFQSHDNDDRFCVNLQNIDNMKKIQWDHRLLDQFKLTDLNYTLQRILDNDIHHNISTAKDNRCYRTDRFDPN